MSVEFPQLMFPLVIDNFSDEIDRVRESALQSGFGTWRPNKGEVGSSVYDGMNFWGLHGILIRQLTRIVKYAVYPNSMFFRVTNEATEAAYVHSDREAGDYTAIVYLSEHEERYGTGFFRHRETGMTHMPSFAELAEQPELFARLKDHMVRGSNADWDLIDYVSGKYNRAVIFDAPRFHARSPRHGFSDCPEKGRLIWACHFKI